MAKDKELEELVEEVLRDSVFTRKKKVLLYLTELHYLGFKARCEKKGQSVSAVIDAFIKRANESERDPATEKRLQKEMLLKAKKRK